ncbi:MAG: hypothetical protein ACHQJ5_10075 [Vicinamibacteria bacterium]|jgi:predicted  nucleic acid-binding Zn-ribbon protein
MTKVAGALAIAAIAFLGAGCGSVDEQNAYVDQVNELRTELLSTVSDLTSSATPSNAAEAADLSGQLEEAYASAADGLEAVEAPDEVADLHSQLVAGLRGIATQIDRAQHALNQASAEQAVQALTDLQTSVARAETELGDLIDQINAEFQD